MVKVLLALWGLAKVTLLEAAGVALIVYGVAQLSHPAAWVVAGVAIVLKSFALDLGNDEAGQ